MTNLKPFTGVDDSRRQNGRKKGSKNLSTIVGELLSKDLDPRIPLNGGVGEFLKNTKTSYAKALVLAMLVKAINGDVRAAMWISNYADKVPKAESFFGKSEIVFQVVPDRSDVSRQDKNLE